jgi:hypothetical protein
MPPRSPGANGRAFVCQAKSAESVVAQIEPRAPYNDWLMDRVVAYLQTRDWRLFPFTANFDVHQQAAFVRDLREGLGAVSPRGSARKTSATGFIASDQILRRIIDEWQAAAGQWPEGSFPSDPETSLGSSSRADSPPRAAYLAPTAEELEAE